MRKFKIALLLSCLIFISAMAFAQQKLNAHNNPPLPTIIAIPDSVCAGDMTLLYVTGINGATYLWSNGATTDSIYVTPFTSKTYSVYIVQGVNHYSDSVTVYIIPPITASFHASPDSICPTGSANLTATVVGGQAIYRWSTGATTSSIIVTPVVTTTYTATVYGRCDSIRGVVTIVVVPLPPPMIRGKDSVCKGSHDTLTVTGGNFYRWSDGSTKNIYVTGDIDADSTISVVAYNSLGCSDTARFTVHVKICNLAVPFISGTGFVNVYPNPSNTEFTVDLENKALLKVCDITGRILFSGIENAGTITFGKELRPGMYFLFIDGKPGVKLVKQ